MPGGRLQQGNALGHQLAAGRLDVLGERRLRPLEELAVGLLVGALPPLVTLADPLCALSALLLDPAGREQFLTRLMTAGAHVVAESRGG